MSMIGKSLAHYSITAQIGKGGMGEVYQATDTKLGRSVAIKVLPEEFAKDADRISRFQREAKLLASLNHPNIAAIHGLEEADGTHFLVLELVEGQTLAERIKGGPIPVEEALKLGLQIAEALEAAHEKGVIHRDMKPANIKVTPEGKVKVLDFGLAKAYAGDPANMNLSNSPTLSDIATQQGIILGTAAYMPPEQAKGKTVDKRADIWAFGVVLFEMLAGRQLFTGETASETLASVIKSEPEWNSLPPNLHPRILMMLERCLEKDPKKRYSGINDSWVDIEKVLSDPGGVYAQPFATEETKAKSRQMLVWASVTAILIIIVGIVVWNLKTQKPPSVTFEYVLPDDQEFNLDQWGHPYFAISSDGRQLVYSTPKGLYIRSVGKRGDPRPISGSENNSQAPFFSPNGEWVGYISPADRKLKKIAVTGGRPIDLCDIETSLAGTQWRSDNTIILGFFPGGIMKIPDSGGIPEPLINNESTEFPPQSFGPQILPDEENVLFTNLLDAQNKEIMIGSLESGKSNTLFPGQAGLYLPSGHIIYALQEPSGEVWYARPFDMDKQKIEGKAVRLPEDIISWSVSDTGTFAYVPQQTDISSTDIGTGSINPAAGRTLWWVDRNGVEEQIPAKPGNYYFPSISPGGNKIALTVENNNTSDIHVFDLLKGMFQQLTWTNDARETVAIWSPDGRRIIYASDNVGTGSSESAMSNIMQKTSDGSGDAEVLYSSKDQFVFPLSVSNDEKLLVTNVSNTGSEWGTGMLSLGQNPKHTILLMKEYLQTNPQLSPDGRWLAYQSNEFGEMEVFVTSFPDVIKGGRWQVSTEGGHAPRWSPKGNELFYLTGGSTTDAVMVVDFETEPTFSPEKPEILFNSHYIGMDRGIAYDIHPEGNKFLMIKGPQLVRGGSHQGPRKIIVVTNWFEELKKLAPAD